MKNSLVLFFAATVVLCGMSPAWAGPNDACYTCHDRDQFRGRVVHKPVGTGKCVTCHNPHVGRYRGMLSHEGGRLCFTCHTGEAETFRTGIVHEPINRFECTRCHDPHASDRNGLVRKNLKESCLECHEDFPERYRFTHEPYLSGDCRACHAPHNSERPMLLVADRDALCGECHEPEDLAPKHRNFPGTLRSCLTCHSPHGSDRKSLIRNYLHEPYAEDCSNCHEAGSGKVGVSACAGCHGDVLEQMQATHSHLTMQSGNACVNCHSPHAGDEKRLLLSREKQVCARCHRPSIEKYKNSPYRHGSIDNCTDCHFPHGGNDMAMLKGNGLEVCALCHENQGKFTHPVGPEVPDPRTGRMITCITCHNPMGTDYKFNLLLEGKRQLCVQCHGEY